MQNEIVCKSTNDSFSLLLELDNIFNNDRNGDEKNLSYYCFSHKIKSATEKYSHFQHNDRKCFVFFWRFFVVGRIVTPNVHPLKLTTPTTINQKKKQTNETMNGNKQNNI